MRAEGPKKLSAGTSKKSLRGGVSASNVYFDQGVSIYNDFMKKYGFHTIAAEIFTQGMQAKRSSYL